MAKEYTWKTLILIYGALAILGAIEFAIIYLAYE